jgi:Bacterial Ig-like domain
VETVAATAGTNRGGETQSGKLETQKVGRSETKSGLVRIVEIFFDITFKSRLAIILLNLSALGFLGCLGFLGFLPGMRFCFGFFGFTGLFGLIGVAFLIEFFSSPRSSKISKSLLPLVAIAVLAGLFVLAIYLHRHSEVSADGADEILAKEPPVVVETFPVSGAQDVEPGETEIRVRFSKGMMDKSWSWSSAWKNSTPDSIGDPQYDTAHRTCSLKVKLDPGHTYAFWLNSGNFHNFQDSDGRPAVPYLLIFHTKAPQGSQANTAPNPPSALTNTNHPYVISVWPPDGATNVDTRQEMRIRFSHGMSPTDFGVMWYSGGYLTNGQIRYDPDHNEFTFPMQLLPGSANKLRVGGWGEGFRDTNGNHADEFSWQFTTKPFAGRAEAPKPHIVQISPDDGQTLPVLTFFQLTFDQPMTLDDGLPYLRKNGMGMDPPILISDCAYDPAANRFTIPVVLPPDNETKLVLEGFRSADGAAADPVAIPCEIGTNNYSTNQLSDISTAAQDPRLVQLLTSIKTARARYTSGIETVQWIMTSQEKSALSWLSGHSALFKWQGTNQFFEDISGIMNIKTFILGTDGKTCWLYSNSKDYPSYLNSTPVALVAKINVCIADPFDLTWRTVKSAIANGKLIYAGKSRLNDRACYRIESWSVKQTGDDNFPVEANKYEWWIDAESFLPLQIIVSGQKWTFRYESLNQSLPASAFQPPIEPGSSPQPEDWYGEKLGRGETRFLTIKDGSDGGMSGRMGRRGPNGTTSSGLN